MVRVKMPNTKYCKDLKPDTVTTRIARLAIRCLTLDGYDDKNGIVEE